jgi:exonuclease SbcC
MRPTRLVVEGFTAFRHLTEVDFDGADLFALTGPTGSGKSSVVDAMVFALYGCVPRLDRRAVAPVISLGRSEARVILHFTVGGVAYTAARVVRRTRTGASTKEARLQRGDEVLAGNEKELTEAVGSLLGLTIDHFTTCVVLPQGEFMRLLHAKPSDRQDLLVKLLDLGLYERMSRVAGGRQHRARQEAELARALLDQVAFATPEALADVEERLTLLTQVKDQVEAAAPELERLGRAATDAGRRIEALAAEVALLTGIEVPEGLADHAVAFAEARRARDEAEAIAERAEADADAADAALAAHPLRPELERAQRAHVDRVEHLARQEKGTGVLADHDGAVATAAAVLTESEAAAVAAAEAVEWAQWDHRAHDLASSLVVGEPCPVCRQEVGELPAAVPSDVLPEARATRQRAEGAVADARRTLEAARQDRERTTAKLASIAEQLSALDGLVAEHPDLDTVERSLAARTEAEGRERTVRDNATRARRTALEARKALAEVDQREGEARQLFDRTRDRLAALGPPAPARHDLAVAWAALVEWADTERPARAEALEAARAEQAEAAAARTDLQATLARAVAAHGIGPAGDGDLRGPVAAALAAASSDRDRVADGLAEAATQRAASAAASRRADLAGELHRLLNAKNFEKWVLDEALAVLVEGATELLLDLTGGAYSLALDPQANFLVVDHRNADEVRPARTLSGGETFVASLALALALADQIGSLAASGSARLESIFLDEGFGTLDAETLDTVAAAIEELGARGRMVGLISHVAELAQRVPVRFEVTRDPAGSTIQKVMA